MSEYPDKPLPDISEISLHEWAKNDCCYSCGDRTRPKQWEERNGYAGPHCTARFICQEEREMTCPTCVYCDQIFVPEANRICYKAPTIDGKTSHSTIDQRIELKDFDLLEKQKKKDDEIIEFLLKHNREEVEKLQWKQKWDNDYYQQIPIISKGRDHDNYDRVRDQSWDDFGNFRIRESD